MAAKFKLILKLFKFKQFRLYNYRLIIFGLLGLTILIYAVLQKNLTNLRSRAGSGTGSFSNLSASLNSGGATFNFVYSGISSFYFVDLSTSPDMIVNTYGRFAEGTFNPVFTKNPGRWGEYTCGKTFFWRVTADDGKSSSPQTAVVNCSKVFTAPQFFDLSATLGRDRGVFTFLSPKSGTSFLVDISLDPNMVSNNYGRFAYGTGSPIFTDNPLQVAPGQYQCGSVVFWRVVRVADGAASGIQSTQIDCSQILPPVPQPTTCTCSTGKNNFCQYAPLTPNCPMTYPGGYCDPNGDGNYDFDADWNRGWYEYQAVCTLPQVSPTPAASPIINQFNNLSATLAPNIASFNFNYSGTTPTFGYSVWMSTDPNFALDIFTSFATGMSSPVYQLDPMNKWDKYTCGRSLYWIIKTVLLATDVQSPVQTGQVSCIGNPASPSPLASASLGPVSVNIKLKFQGVVVKRPNQTVSLIFNRLQNNTNTYLNVLMSADNSGIYTNSVPIYLSSTGAYTLYVKGPVHLTRKFTDITLYSGYNTLIYSSGFYNLLAGDIYGTGNATPDEVDQFDYAKVLTDFGPRMPTGGSIADLDFDGDVDHIDYAILVLNYGKQGEK